MSVAVPSIVQIQDAHDYDQFQAFPGGVLMMTPDTVPVSFAVPSGYTALWNNMQVGSGETVEAVGTLVDPGWSDALYMLNMGDSKTAGDAWTGLLLAELNLAEIGSFDFHPQQVSFSVSGGMVNTIASIVAARVPAMGQPVELVTLNIGINDAVVFTDEDEFKADYRAILDTILTRWPHCKIYVAYVWARLYAVQAGVLDGWIADIVAEYSSGVHVGMDERVWLEGGDDGATNSADGVHYSTAGQTAAAAAWAAGIGV